MALTGQWARLGQGQVSLGVGDRGPRHEWAGLPSLLLGLRKSTHKQDADPAWAGATLQHCPPSKSEHSTYIGGPEELR